MEKPKLLEVLIYSNSWVALGCAFLSAETLMHVNQCLNGWVFMQMFAATFVVYNLQRFVKSNQYETNSRAGIFTQKNKTRLQVSVVICIIFLVLSPWKWSLELIFFIVSLLAFSALYVIRVLPTKSRKRISLREVPMMKVLVVTGVWSLATTILPLWLSESTVNDGTGAMVMERWTFLMAITIPFDLRDMHVDHPSSRTIPQLIGASGARIISTFFILAMLAVNLYRLSAGWISVLTFIAISIVALITLVLIKKAKPDTNSLLFAGWLDGTMVIRGLLVGLSVVSEVQGLFEC